MAVKRVECPECGHRIAVSASTRIGAKFECEECGELLEVISEDPIEVDFADWGDDDDDWDEE